MTAEDAEADVVDIDGMQLEAAVDAVVDADESRDRTVVCDALERITEDGIIDASLVNDAMAGVSRNLSAARDRANMAAFELSKAKNAAEGIDDLTSVRTRLDLFEREVETLSARAADLDDEIERVTGLTDSAESLFTVAAGIQEANDEAASVEMTAVEITPAIEEFREWVESPEMWVNELQGDLHIVEETLEGIADIVEDLAAALDGEADTGIEDPALVWYDSTLRIEVVALMLEDVRVELDDLETLRDRGKLEDEWYPDVVADELADLTERRTAVADRLADLALSEWTERFDDRLTEFEAHLDAIEPPLDWTEMEATLEEYRITPEDDE